MRAHPHPTSGVEKTQTGAGCVAVAGRGGEEEKEEGGSEDNAHTPHIGGAAEHVR